MCEDGTRFSVEDLLTCDLIPGDESTSRLCRCRLLCLLQSLMQHVVSSFRTHSPVCLRPQIGLEVSLAAKDDRADSVERKTKEERSKKNRLWLMRKAALMKDRK